MTLLEQKLLQSTQLDKHAIHELLKVFNTSTQLKPKEILVDFQQRDSRLYFINKGCVRLYVVDTNDDEKNIGFGYENTFITSFQSFVNNTPSLMCIEAVMNSEVVMVPKESLDHLINANVKIAQWYRSMIEGTLAGHIQRQIELLTLNPQERYNAFQKRSGHIINAIPLKLIASYLMMTPETLSRVRAMIS